MREIKVNADNFALAETHRMMADLQRDAGAVNRFLHNREPAAIDKQTVIRLNRDTLYSFAVVDISSGAVLTVPDAGDRYLSVMIVNEGHYIKRGPLHQSRLPRSGQLRPHHGGVRQPVRRGRGADAGRPTRP